jgi:hypothetical protein
MDDIHYLKVVENYIWIAILWWQLFWQMAQLTRSNTMAINKLTWYYAVYFQGDG